ncbi:hypothetical protein AVEN_97530-1 [Araneus ventricosus]|uniref:Reverse transcriptase domain-containing protein n=1 Tax=Araneus ventricosus TaxID=182803 RepID=A0A4Y2KM49_ARAVE|nr:hypothetical protein AVEN_97530-1 [Araneus ventricosus]
MKSNEITIKDTYPLPQTDDTLNALNGNQWFSTLDLKSEYWQVEIRPEDREKTAFTSGQGPSHKQTDSLTDSQPSDSLKESK